MIIGISGYAQSQASEHEHPGALDHYLIKPIDFATLRGLIETP